jgi:RNA polymerase sigma-70 factor, ECF subfamily
MTLRSNEEWLQVLGQRHSVAKDEALAELQDFLIRSVLVYLSLHRDELTQWSHQAIYELAEDIAQDSLLDILNSLETFRNESRFTTWAYRFAVNRAASELRHRRYRNLSLDRLLEQEASGFEALLTTAKHQSQERQIEQRAYVQLLHNLITTRLTERERAAIIGIYLQGYSMDEVARALDTNRNALYKLLHTARQHLKEALLARHLTQNDILSAFDE